MADAGTRTEGYYELDTLARLYPSLQDDTWSAIFRMQADLSEPVDAELLQTAADDCRRRFPYLYVALRREAFGYRLKETDGRVLVRPDTRHPLAYLSEEEAGHSCLRILYGERRIAIEMYHILCDGTGTLYFFCTLLHRYLELAHGPLEGESPYVLDIDEPADPEEWEDAFVRYAQQDGDLEEASAAFCPAGTETSGHHNLVTTCEMDTAELLAHARALGVSMTSYMSAVIVSSLIGLQERQAEGGMRRPVRLSVPVNLRNMFPSRTMRNFIFAAYIGVEDPAVPTSFEALCQELDAQLKSRSSKEHMQACIDGLVSAMHDVVLEVMPRVLTDFVVDKVVMPGRGEDETSLDLSNMGRIVVPEGMARHVTRMMFVPGTERNYPFNVMLSSYRDKTYLVITRDVEEMTLVHGIVDRLRGLGLSLSLG